MISVESVVILSMLFMLISSFNYAAENSTIDKKKNGLLKKESEEALRQFKLEALFFFDEHLSAYKIDTEVVSHKAILKGTVNTNLLKRLAEQKALSVDGIDEVDNQLLVN